MQVSREDSNKREGITPGCVVEYEGEQYHVIAAWDQVNENALVPVKPMLRIAKVPAAEYSEDDSVDLDAERMVGASTVTLVDSSDALEVEIVEPLPTEGRFWKEEIEIEELAERRMRRFMPVLDKQ